MEKEVRDILLYDLYGSLLTDHQRSIYEAYREADLSPSEIAENEGVSRQSIFDTVRRVERLLESYEEKLGILEGTTFRGEVFSAMEDLLTREGDWGNEEKTLLREQLEKWRRHGI